MLKPLLTSAVALAALVSAGAASAADPITIAGSAEKFCTLPDTWSASAPSGGAATGQFTGMTWTIPEALLSDAQGQPVVGSDFGMRIVGVGHCNASHTIQLTSARGGLVTGVPGAATPDNFSRRRNIRYDAYWSLSGGSAVFGANVNNFNPTSPGQPSNVANFQVGPGQAPPGERQFHLRVGLQRPAGAAPLLAGAYSDNLTITITLAP
ncbi:MAG: hypothetical protein Q7T61_15975 [Caulobacter sp.]|nr:hypothetical protein [Caulobacter sp.]